MQVKRTYLTVQNGGKARSLKTATEVATKLGIDFEKVEILQDEEGFYLQEIDKTPMKENIIDTNPISIPNELAGAYYDKTTAQTPEGEDIEILTPNSNIIDKSKSVMSVEDALQILRDNGIDVASKQEVKEYNENAKLDQLVQVVTSLAQSTQQMSLDNQATREANIQQELKEKEHEKIVAKKMSEDVKKSINKIATEPKISMAIVRRRNAHGTSTEKKRTAFGKNGELLRNLRGESYSTEVVELCLNNELYPFDIGPDTYGRSEGMVQIHNVPWSVAVNLAERRYPQVLTHPLTGEVVIPFHMRNHLETSSNMLTDEGHVMQSGIGQAMSR